MHSAEPHSVLKVMGKRRIEIFCCDIPCHLLRAIHRVRRQARAAGGICGEQDHCLGQLFDHGVFAFLAALYHNPTRWRNDSSRSSKIQTDDRHAPCERFQNDHAAGVMETGKYKGKAFSILLPNFVMRFCRDPLNRIRNSRIPSDPLQPCAIAS